MPRFVTDSIGDRGVQLTGSPISYNGSELEMAQNVVLTRDGNLMGLTKRPGLFPLADVRHMPEGDDPVEGRPIHGIIPVPFTDTQEVQVSIYSPYDESIVTRDKFSAWSSDFREVYALSVATATPTQIYLASNDYDVVSAPPALAVSIGATNVPVFKLRVAEGTTTYPGFISCVKAIEEGEITYIYCAAVTYFKDDSYICVFKYNSANGAVAMVGGFIVLSNRNSLVSDIISVGGSPFISIATPDRLESSRILRGNDWVEVHLKTSNVVPLSALNNTSQGLIYLGCSNSPEQTAPARILAIDPSENVSTIVSTPTGSGWSGYTSLTLFEGTIYAVRYKTLPRVSITVGRIVNTGWEEDVVVRGLDEDGNAVDELWPSAEYAGQMSVINGDLYLSIPSVTDDGALLRRRDGDWSVVGRDRSYRGVVLGTLDE